MKNFLLTVSYDGTHFCGWQRQQEHRSVQQELEKALTKIHKIETLAHGSGRTDSGVHAIGQAVTFESPIDSIPEKKYIPALNSILPTDIRIADCVQMNSGFHARFNAITRTYRYFIHTGISAFAHQMPYIWAIYRKPNLEKLNAMASCLQGEIDFSTFCAAGDQSVSKTRYIEKAHFFEEKDLLIFEITANAFLWKMVRSLVGTLIHFEKTYQKEAFYQALHDRNRKSAGPTAPPQGLFLWHVNFDGQRYHIKT
ncbi:MAG: tRNA pseudouridine(38-40) synthase TruA [Treponemataceae bacterium]